MTSRAAPTRLLFLHADDFGLNEAVNRGIVESFRYGALTGTSLLANGPAAEQAAASWRDLEAERSRGALPSREARCRLSDDEAPFDLGLHFNLTQGFPLTDDYPTELRRADGSFPGIGRLFVRLCARPERYAAAIRREFEAQWRRVVDLGLTPGHVNGHQYVELAPGVDVVVAELLPKFGVRYVRTAYEPGLGRTTFLAGRWGAGGLGCVKRAFARRFRDLVRPGACVTSGAYFGLAHAGRITLEVLRSFFRAAGAAESVEIGMHPGSDATTADGAWLDPLAKLRPREAALLQSDAWIETARGCGFRLGRFSSLATSGAGAAIAAPAHGGVCRGAR